MAHYLESWGDTRAYDGTATIVQPLIAPLYEGKTAYEVLALFSDNYDQKPYDMVRNYWSGQQSALKSQAQSVSTGSGSDRVQNAGGTPANLPKDAGAPANAATDFESSWRKWLHDGFIPNTALPAKTVSLKSDWANSLNQDAGKMPTLPANSYEVIFRPDPSIYDGRFANNGWLQELPKPLTKLAWDNAALLSPQTAQRLGLTEEIASRGGEHGQMSVSVVELNYQGRTLRAPVWIMPGHAEESVTVYLGYGRERAGRVGDGRGSNAYLLRTSDAPWFGFGLEIKRTDDSYSLACTQAHHSMEGRELVRFATVDEYRSRPDFARKEADDPERAISLYPDWKYRSE